MPKKLDFEGLAGALRAFLWQRGPSSGRDLCRQLGISQPTLSRLVDSKKRDILVLGKARAARYAWKRSIPYVDSEIPVYQVSSKGQLVPLATLYPMAPHGFYLQPSTSQRNAISGHFFPDLPYFMEELRPAGFLGRLIPKYHPALKLPADILLWNGDHVLRYLTEFGWDGIGNLIVGETAAERYLASLQKPHEVIAKRDRKRAYPQLAEQVLSVGPIGSSAGGEQPKFLTQTGKSAQSRSGQAVLVKFSPPQQDPVGRRSSDLLVCEHIVHRILLTHGLAAAQSELVVTRQRTFLEIVRFDRIGGLGRRGVLSLAALDAQFVGRLESWSKISAELLQQGRIDKTTYRNICWLELFGQLIGNTDQHAANLSFFFDVEKEHIEGLAPVYDMLPACYAPYHGQLNDQELQLPLPLPSQADLWQSAWKAALAFWHAVEKHPLISTGFKKLAKRNGTRKLTA